MACQVAVQRAGISESGYYRYLKRKDVPSRDELLSGEIKKVLDESPYNSSYGVRRMRLAMAAENLLRQNFRADRPFQKLLTDITQIRCAGGKLYISPIMDCFYGEILSLCMADNMRKELCVDTLKAAAGRFPIRGAILHSDQGSQYTSGAFRQTLEICGVIQSRSGAGHCYDNARKDAAWKK